MHLSMTLVAGAVGALLAMAATGGPVTAAPETAAPSGVLSFMVKDIDGNSVSLDKYRGKVLMIVNTASLCGNTPQYAGLETLYETYKDRGFEILAFPANNFMAQEPGTDGMIKQFCTRMYKTKFDLFAKISVKGDDQAPLYTFLTSKTTDPQFGGDIEWNFAKFLIDRNGNIVDRFPAGHKPLEPDVVKAVETALDAPAPK